MAIPLHNELWSIIATRIMKRRVMLRRRDGYNQHYRVGRKAKAKKAKKGSMGLLKFFDLKAKKSFTTSNYQIRTKNGKTFAVTTAPSGITS